jgi:hypothetical protein
MTQELKGMMVDIYSSGYSNTSNFGISYTHESVLVVGEKVPGIFTAGNLPIVDLRCKQLANGEKYLYAAPYLCNNSMAGGSFIWSTDSRFRRDISERPIPLHDRFENTCSLSDRYFLLIQQYNGAFGYHKKENLKANAVKLLNETIQFIKFNRNYSSKEEALGILISQWAEWDISILQEVACAAFEDSNASQLAEAIEQFDFGEPELIN